MQGGFPYNESGYYWLVCSSPNPVKGILDQRRHIEPGDSSEYSNVSANLLGYAVSKATNMKLEEQQVKGAEDEVGAVGDERHQRFT